MKYSDIKYSQMELGGSIPSNSVFGILGPKGSVTGAFVGAGAVTTGGRHNMASHPVVMGSVARFCGEAGSGELATGISDSGSLRESLGCVFFRGGKRRVALGAAS